MTVKLSAESLAKAHEYAEAIQGLDKVIASFKLSHPGPSDHSPEGLAGDGLSRARAWFVGRLSTLDIEYVNEADEPTPDERAEAAAEIAFQETYEDAAKAHKLKPLEAAPLEATAYEKTDASPKLEVELVSMKRLNEIANTESGYVSSFNFHPSWCKSPPNTTLWGRLGDKLLCVPHEETETN